ncbi:MAG: histidinol-phosphatase [Epsilonproteobacteria bacterium]|nr:histidinol-phosphatase [Campylobacterota bacterium]
MKVDIHNHTKLCNHAEGEPFEYVEQAIKNKTEYFGFSDHAPMNFDEKYRMSFEDMRSYENSINELKERYKDKITILLGYEVDFLPGYVDERVLKADVDFLVGSVHFLSGWGFDNPEFIGEYKEKDIDKIWQDYFDAIEMMAKSGDYDIVAHLDLIKVFKFLPKKDVRLIAKNAIKAIKKANMTIELNSAGLRKPCKEIYPSQKLMELISDEDIPVTFCSDAHKPEQVGYESDKLISYAKSFGYTKCAIFEKRDRRLINF